MFREFLYKFRTSDNSSLVEAIDSIYRELHESVNYPNGFDIKEFESQPSYAAKVRYADSKLEKLGKGSARTVYKIDDETVLKVAHNQKGIAQNYVESDWSMHSYHGHLLPDLIDHDDENNLWLVKQRANRIKKSEFKKMVGISFDEFGMALRNRARELMGKSTIFRLDNYDEILEDEFFDDVMKLINDHDLEAGDMEQISNWGKLSDEETPVLTDVGLNKTVYKEHYSRK